MWYRAKQRIDAGFETTFQFRISALFGGGADGLVFVIQNHGADSYNIAGNGGCGIGYQTIRRALVVEFDTFKNDAGFCPDIGDPTVEPTTTFAAPDMHHIGILGYGTAENLASHTNSGALVNAVQILPRPTGTASGRGYLEDGVTHLVTIRYVASSRLFEARIDGRPYLSVTLPQDLTTLVGATDGKAYVGFTAGTASESAHHDILSWRFTSTNEQPDTVGVYRPPTTGTPKGAYYLRNSNSSGPANITAWLDFANNVNEVPVVGDWNGDGIDTVGVYNRSNGIYELVNTNANAATAAITAAYGSPGSWPVVGDWNGDGIDT